GSRVGHRAWPDPGPPRTDLGRAFAAGRRLDPHRAAGRLTFARSRVRAFARSFSGGSSAVEGPSSYCIEACRERPARTRERANARTRERANARTLTARLPGGRASESPSARVIWQPAQSRASGY